VSDAEEHPAFLQDQF